MALLALLAAVGCGSPTEVSCPSQAHQLIVVDVRDSNTGLPNWFGALGVAIDGDRVEFLSVRFPPEDTMEVANFGTDFSNDPGKFTVIIDKIGYERWVQKDVKVELGPGACRPIVTEELVAELVRR